MKYILTFLISFSVYAAEIDYQKAWCPNKPGTTIRDIQSGKVIGYVDCLTKTHAYEFDYAKKYHEAIGQSLWYAMNTGRIPGIVLIVEKDSDMKYVKRLRLLANHYGLFKKENIIVIKPDVLK